MQANRWRVPAPCVVIAAAALLLSGCLATTRVSDLQIEIDSARAAGLTDQGEYAAAAELYEELAAQTRASRRDSFLLRAAEQWYLANEIQRAGATLAGIAGPIRGAKGLELALLTINLDLRTHDPDLALERLATLTPYPEDYAAAFLEVEARAHLQQGDAVEAVLTLMQREATLPDPGTVLASRHRMWERLQEFGAAGGELGIPTGADPTLAGWLALGQIAADVARNPFALESRLAAWQEAYPEHPANEGLLDELVESYQTLMQYPERVALLLPLSGRMLSAAAAVRDGFLAAYFQHEQSLRRPNIRIYDTAALGPVEAYSRAIAAGTDFVVGPLTREAVAAVAPIASADFRTLALNNVADEIPTAQTMFQFALAPEDEATQAARRAATDGWRKGVALVPDNEWGMRLLSSFASEFEQHGGTLLAFRIYDPAAQDYSAPITQLLLLDQSRRRHQNLEARLGQQLEFEPRRRQDAEFVFLGTRVRQGRLIRPQLRFHYAADLPLYATSAAYEPDPRANRDLDGMVFTDMPWTIAPDTTTAEIQATLGEYWPTRASRRARLFAMGFDAYRLIPLLHNQLDPLQAPVAGMTGILTTDARGRLHRELVWARIESGEPRLLSTQIAAAVSVQPESEDEPQP